MLNQCLLGFPSRLNVERGAALVESMLSSVVLIFITGLMIDISFGMQRHGELAERITQTTRRAAAAPCTTLSPETRRGDSSPHGNPVPGSLPELIRAAVTEVTGNPESVRSVAVRDSGFSCDQANFSPPIGAHGHPQLEAQVRIGFPCIFCFLVGGLDLNMTARVPVEDTGAACGYPVSC
jgi:hypothetical protein